MSMKRQATTDLNHENWDQDDPDDQEEDSEGFKMASKDVLEKRVMRTARRRTQVTGDEPKKSVFSGFTGFNKTQQTSFDFLSKLTNGNNATKPNNELKVTSNSLTSTTSSPFTGISSISGTSTPVAKPTFGKSNTGSSLFGGIASSGFGQSVFSTSKPNTSGNDNPFKIQTTQSQAIPTSSALNTSAEKPTPQISSTLFGSQAPSNTVNSSSPLKTQTESTSQPSDISETETNKSDSIQDENKFTYYSKLKNLNESVSEWIKMHVDKTPLCILTPIFKDYDRYLNQIQDAYEKGKEKPITENIDENKKTDAEVKTSEVKTSPWATTTTSSSLFSTSSSPLFSTNKNNTASQEKTSNFSTGLQSSPNTLTSNTSTPTAGFSFGIKSPTSNPLFGIKTSTETSPFAASATTTNTNGSTPFSFGAGKPFSFNSNVQKTEDAPKEEENEDEPPKVEYNPIVEENSVYDKKCKVFVKKDGNYIDKGVGTLYLKKIEDSGKHQLLMRANSALGNILLNFILSSSIPTQRMGKNNVMMVCIPTPDSKPPPTSILIRVKTSEEADELLETLNKYKV